MFWSCLGGKVTFCAPRVRFLTMSHPMACRTPPKTEEPCRTVSRGPPCPRFKCEVHGTCDTLEKFLLAGWKPCACAETEREREREKRVGSETRVGTARRSAMFLDRSLILNGS